MDALQLRRIFEALLRTSLASPLLIAGCAPDLTGYESPRCDGYALAVTGLSPSVIPDVVQLRQRTDLGGTEQGHMVQSSSGVACATAQDPQTCQSELEQLSPTEGFRSQCLDYCSSYYLATTRGDQVTAMTTIDSVRGFLGEIDTSQEAALLAFAHGYNLSCDDLERGAVRANALGGYDVIGSTGFACGLGTKVTQFILRVTASGEVQETSQRVLERGDANCVVGRRPAGLRQRIAMHRAGVLGRHFAGAAQLEAAAVDAFLRLRAELRTHGAPRALQQSALVSAVEEVSHAQVTRRLAEAHGASPIAPSIAKLPLRPLFEVALDNRMEGCVRETYGALVAHHQAQHARDPRTRQMMQRIAVEETHHAALSWAVDRWACSKLDRADRAALREAQLRAAVELREEAAARNDGDLIAQAGLPEPEKAVALVEQLTRELAA